MIPVPGVRSPFLDHAFRSVRTTSRALIPLWLPFPHPPTPATSGSLIDTSGNLVWDINAKLFTLSGRRIVMDANKNELGQIKRMHMKTPGIHDIWYIGPMDDIKKCSVRCTR